MNKKDDGKVYMLEESRTIQSAADECDINKIVARAKAGDDITSLFRTRPGQYRDMTEIPTDLRDAIAIVQRADALFMALDANVRERFGNNPAKMIDFLKDPQNRKEAIELGLVKGKETDEALETLKSIDQSLKTSSDAKKAKAKPAADEA